MYRVAVVGGKPAPISGAKELGIDVVLVHEEGKYDLDELGPHCERIVHAAIDDRDAILAVLRPLHRERPFDLLLTSTEDAAIPVAAVNAELGLPGTSERTSRIIKDKALTRRALAEHGLSPVRFRAPESAEDAADFQGEVGDRIVVKPIDGVASLHIHVATTPQEAAAAWTALQEAGYSRVIAEEYLDGPVVSVDSFSHQGRHIVVGMSEYLMNDLFVEWQVATISETAWPHREALRAATAELLDAVGLTDGPAHSEFVLTPAGPRVLETHNRLAGSGAPDLVRRATGVDLARMFLTVPLGIDKLPETHPEPTGGAAIRFFVPEAGRITAITGLDEVGVPVLRVPPGVRPPHIIPYLYKFAEDEAAVVISKSEGDTVNPLRAVMDCDNGYVLAQGRDMRDAVAKAAALTERIRFHVE
ncbi:ATP-grasp domain-containing protein [Kitasatospora sp. NA04385]|uniref:ATP-grasp domain-containing protein n=1 Tax=Kitasatospora sp. NA04385 TaxID=2742135 RepID=UPI001590A053|nr:ATP-grasp domain-containing protein [Kitasatospora sp. NA04385]QKW20277.1 ATP-grasp domain-containing protein [Kitasatospora sp. NA04385]